MIAARKRTTHREAALVSLAAVATAAAVAACGSTQAPSTSGQAPSQSGTPSSGATLQANGSGVCGAVPKLTALTVHRVNHLPQNHEKFVFPATDMVTSPGQVRAVATSLCGLPQSSGPVACPMDNGVTYQFTFTEGSKKFAAVTAEASGCGIVKGLGKPRRDVASSGLWQHLGLAIGIPHPNQDSFSGKQTANS
ncbi:MAG TPA: hypothetical protein VH089_00610 [Streptosporangiaceae bacterium]|nr:hypothetical protein [Streptosporangiaceae bacterium]